MQGVEWTLRRCMWIVGASMDWNRTEPRERVGGFGGFGVGDGEVSDEMGL